MQSFGGKENDFSIQKCIESQPETKFESVQLVSRGVTELNGCQTENCFEWPLILVSQVTLSVLKKQR